MAASAGAHLRGADVEGGHAIGLEPDAHRERARSEDVRPLHPSIAARRGWTARTRYSVIWFCFEDVRGEAQVGGGELAVGRLDAEGNLGLGRQEVAHAVHLRADLGQRPCPCRN